MEPQSRILISIIAGCCPIVIYANPLGQTKVLLQ